MYKIGFLGLGKMGSSILKGILKKELYSKEDICFYAPSKATKEKGIAIGISLKKDERDLVSNSSIILLAIEPQKYDEVFLKFSNIDFINKIVISLAPGKTIAYLKDKFKNAFVVRAMPNTPSLINKGVTMIAFDEKEIKEVLDIFSSIGTYKIVEEKQIDILIPLQGSMPAYIFAFIKAFVDASKEYGIEEEVAKRIAIEAIIGSCELALDKEDSLDNLIDSVCSKGGSTIAGLEELKKNDFFETIKKCYNACVKRSMELRK